MNEQCLLFSLSPHHFCRHILLLPYRAFISLSLLYIPLLLLHCIYSMTHISTYIHLLLPTTFFCTRLCTTTTRARIPFLPPVQPLLYLPIHLPNLLSLYLPTATLPACHYRTPICYLLMYSM